MSTDVVWFSFTPDFRYEETRWGIGAFERAEIKHPYTAPADAGCTVFTYRSCWYWAKMPYAKFVGLCLGKDFRVAGVGENTWM